MSETPRPSRLDNHVDCYEDPRKIEEAAAAHLSYKKLTEKYSALLRARVFGRTPIGYDDKELTRFRRVLDHPTTYQVLLEIWSASQSVPEDIARGTGFSTALDLPQLTANGLATGLALSPREVPKTVFRVRNVALAAAAYGLLERDKVTSTLAILQGTRLLHELMMDLGLCQRTGGGRR